MNTDLLSKLPPHSRVWVFQADRFFTAEEQAEIENAMREFIPKWASHGNEIYGDFAVAESLFIMVGADEEKSPASGCSIDSLNRYVQQIGDRMGINFFNRLLIAYVDKNQKTALTPMSGFKAMIKNKEVSESTIVFNNLVLNKEEFDSGWRTPLANSWHKNLADVI